MIPSLVQNAMGAFVGPLRERIEIAINKTELAVDTLITLYDITTEFSQNVQGMLGALGT